VCYEKEGKEIEGERKKDKPINERADKQPKDWTNKRKMNVQTK